MQDSNRRLELDGLQRYITGTKKGKHSPAGSGPQTLSALRSPPRSSGVGVNLSNLSLSKGKQTVQGLNFADILDDVTYLPDPSASQHGKEPGAAFLRMPPAQDPRSELKIASYTYSGKNRTRYEQPLSSNSFEIADAVSQDVSKQYQGSQDSSAGQEQPMSGSQAKDHSPNLSEQIASVQSYAI